MGVGVRMDVGVGGALQRIRWIHRELSFGRKKIQENPASLSRVAGQDHQGSSLGTQAQ